MIRRILPYPLFFVLLVLMWLVLQQSLGLGQVLLGILVAFLATRIMAALNIPNPTIRKPLKILRLIWIVAIDVLKSNIAVALLLLAGRRAGKPGFLVVPLDIREPLPLAVLACIVTATPGSAWLEYRKTESTVLIHVLDLSDEQAWIDTIKTRYETLLKEIFA